MPPKRQAIGRSTSRAKKHRASRDSETDEQRDARLQTVRASTAQARSSESTQQREARLETMRVSNAQARFYNFFRLYRLLTTSIKCL